jgi:hypothetical protein
VIGLTCGRFTVVAQTERRLAIAGDEAVAARPPRLRLWLTAGNARPSGAIGGSRVG